MDITNIRIFLNEGGDNPNLKGVAHVVLNNAIVLRRIHIVERVNDPGNLRVIYPVYHLKAGNPNLSKDDKGFRRCFYPNPDNRAEFDAAILDAFEKVRANPELAAQYTNPMDGPEIPFEVTNSIIYPHNEADSNTLATVSVELDHTFWLRGMYLTKRQDGTCYLRMPSRALPDGRRVNQYHPRTQAARDMLTDAVMPLYAEAVAKAGSDNEEAPA